MKSKELNSPQPFWVDDHAAELKSTERIFGSLAGFSKFYGFFLLFQLFILVIFVFSKFSSSFVVWICGGYLLLKAGASIYVHWVRKSTGSKAEEIQHRAYEKTGAELIGSAVHVAGHPLLDRDLAVVIALHDDRLDIYDYTSSTPLTSISIEDIEAVKTVTYDEDRIPHTEVIDNSAQALQLEFRWQDKECACLFRGMKKIRPIGWYDAIQKVRLA